MSVLEQKIISYTATERTGSSLNIPINTPPRKDRKITFRVLEKTHSILEGMAKQSNIPLSEFMNQVSLQYINYIVTLHDVARHYYQCSPDKQRRILEFEAAIPPAARQFTMALKAYPDKEMFYGKGEAK